MYQPPMIKDVVEALESLKNIERPYGDNEGDPINSPDVYNELQPDDKELVDRVEVMLQEYIRKPGDLGEEPNKRALTELEKHGYPASLNHDQYNPDRLVGHVEVGDWTIDLSDPSSENDQD
jgi:hypothetical protein